VANEQPAEQGHGKWFDRPIDEQRYANATHMTSDLIPRRKINLEQHRDDHDPDQHADRQIHVGNFQTANQFDAGGKGLSCRHTDHDA